MSSLFSIFNCETFMNLSLNWISIYWFLIYPSSYWMCYSYNYYMIMMIMNMFENMIMNTLKEIPTPGISHFLISIFMLLAYTNLFSLYPFIFSVSSHLSFTLAIAMPIWIGYIMFIMIMNMNPFLVHLVPFGTPYPLISFMIMIEIISNLIRPIALSVRLAANMTAGHILIAVMMVSYTMSSNIIIFMTMSIMLLFLFILEIGVSFIQSHVFTTLISLYIEESNNPNM